MKFFPVFLKVENKSIVVFGGGADAAAKLRLVQKTQARIIVVAEEIQHEVLDLGTAHWAQSSVLDFELPDDLVLAYAATGHAEMDAALARKVQAHGALCCAVDQIDPSDFSTPAIVDRDPVVVAIGTEGTAPVLARKVKAENEAMLEESLGTVAQVANSLRPLVAELTLPGQQRRAFWQHYFEQARKRPSCAARIGQELLSKLEAPSADLSLVQCLGTSSALSEKAKAAIHGADVVLAGSQVHSSVLELCRREAMRLDDQPANHARIAKALRDNEQVVVLRGENDLFDLMELFSGFGIEPTVHPWPTASVVPFTLPKAA